MNREIMGAVQFMFDNTGISGEIRVRWEKRHSS